MDTTLTVETGRDTGTRNARRQRRTGHVPGVVYGLGVEPTPVSVPWPELRRSLTTEAGVNALVSLSMEGTTRLAVIRELQRHPVRRDVTHVDFLLIDPDAPLAVDVPITLTGVAPAVEAWKGMIDQLVYTLAVKAKPGAIPNSLELDISHLEIGTQAKAGEVVLPEGVTTEVDPELAIAQGSATRSTILLQQEKSRAERKAAGEDVGDEEPADFNEGI